MEGFIGQIMMFGGNFAIRSWALCNGQLLAISQNTALFSILGTTYGGDGRTTFGLPDMRGRSPMGEGNGPGLTDRRLGQKFGVEDVVLNTTQIPSHAHPATTTTQIAVSAAAGGESTVNGQHIANHTSAFNEDPTAGATLAGATSSTTVGNAGGNLSHNNMQPNQVVTFLICIQGVFPSRS